MIRTQIQLDEGSYDALHSHAARRRVSMASCIRTAIEEFLTRSAEQRDDLSDVAGKFSPLPMDDVKPLDRVWSDAVTSQRGGRP
jgi:hypothetical protein